MARSDTDGKDPRSELLRGVGSVIYSRWGSCRGPILIPLWRPLQRARGILARIPQVDTIGYWLAPCRAVHGFGLSAEIDLVFLDGRLIVTRIVAAMPPWRVAGCRAARSVLELRAGALNAFPSLAPGARMWIGVDCV